MSAQPRTISAVASADVRDECAFVAGFWFGEFVFNFQGMIAYVVFSSCFLNIC